MFRIFGGRSKRKYEVDVFVCGKHPYLSEKQVQDCEQRTGNQYGYPSFVAMVEVEATGLSDAAERARRKVADDPKIRGWSYRSVCVRLPEAPDPGEEDRR